MSLVREPVPGPISSIRIDDPSSTSLLWDKTFVKSRAKYFELGAIAPVFRRFLINVLR